MWHVLFMHPGSGTVMMIVGMSAFDSAESAVCTADFLNRGQTQCRYFSVREDELPLFMITPSAH
jgi:hypothetical protein